MDSLTLADGTVIDKSSGNVLPDDNDYVPVPSNMEIQRDIVASHKRLHDLPLPPEKMNIVSVVLVYSLMGITEEDIATTLRVDEDIIRNIKTSDVYASIKKEFVNAIIENDLDNVRDMFTSASHTAARSMVEMLESNNEATKMSAAKDILDRAGHRPVDVIEHKHKIEGGLTIEVVKKTANDDLPTIDITPEKL